ncbi:MAG: viperin family antiviral radical SAM protein [Deferrisomatales bacterium]
MSTHGFTQGFAVNYHLWPRCNMSCGFCFCTKWGPTPRVGLAGAALARAVTSEIANAGLTKITFAGGEPTLCPWLGDALRHAKGLGLATMIVTNGSHLSSQWFKENASFLDWAAVSIDSLDPRTNTGSGRSVRGRGPLTSSEYLSVCRRIREAGVRLKINTAVSLLNWQEDLNSLAEEARPDRWKILQVLPVVGQNERQMSRFAITSEQFQAFCSRHAQAGAIAEDNDGMTSSYLMIDCHGRLFDNARGRYRRSRPLPEVGWEAAIADVEFSPDKFLLRGGRYDWQSPAHPERRSVAQDPAQATPSGRFPG